MKKKLLITSTIVLAIAFGAIFESKVNAQNTQNFSIESMTSDYYLKRSDDGVPQAQVKESIVAVFPDYNQNHGILRAIPTEYNGQTLGLKVNSVTDKDGKAVEYKTYKENNNLVIKIGNASKYVLGRQVYNIDYSMKNFISFYGDHDEFYWDVNGDEWSQNFGVVRANIHLPDNLSRSLQENIECFSGIYGSSQQDCTKNTTRNVDGTATIKFQANNLEPKETLSFVVGFNKDTFEIDQNELQKEKYKKYASYLVAIFIPLFVFMLMYKKWLAVGRDDEQGKSIVPQYDPLAELNPMTSMALIHDKFESKSVSAQIIDLAVRGYIVLRELENKGFLGKNSKDYELEIIKDTGGLDPLEMQALKMFFSGETAVGQKVKISELKQELSGEATSLGKGIINHLTQEKYYKSNPTTIKAKFMGLGTALLFFSPVLLFLISPFPDMSSLIVGLVVGISLSGAVIAIMARYLPAKTLKGSEAENYLLGLKHYISLAEADRLKFHQSPEGASNNPKSDQDKINLFEKLLPYAMIFDLEKEWAEQFEDTYKVAPDWYQGNWSSFRATALASSVGSFSSANSVTFSPPSSSSSSGFSSGGGFSGGGGGGGGGGGW